MTLTPLKFLVFSLLILLPQMVVGGPGQRKTSSVSRSSDIIRVDGRADEPAWASSSVYEDFTQYEPANGFPSAFETKVRMLFDDEGIYVFAEMFDNHPDSISKELGKRDSDNQINADWFSIDLCPFDDGVNGFSFKLTVTGVQTDIKRGSGNAGREVTWDAIWNAGTTITATGWTAEIFVPFSSIRFPVSGSEFWGINFHRFVAGAVRHAGRGFGHSDRQIEPHDDRTRIVLRGDPLGISRLFSGPAIDGPHRFHTDH